MIVPFPPGGAADMTARAVSKGLAEILNQTVVVENKPGASGIIAGKAMMASPADGHTLLLASNSITTSKWLVPNLTFDVVRDFRGIGMVMKSPHMAVVGEQFPGKGVQDLVRMAKARPGRTDYATAGIGTAPHLFAEIFQQATGTSLTGIPYKGSAPALTAVLAGEVAVYFDILMSSQALLASGKLKSLAVSSTERLPQYPDVLTFAEQGIEGLESYSWFGIVVKTGTPEPVMQKLNQALNQIIQESQFAANAVGMGAIAVGGSASSFQTVISDDTERWGRIIKEKNIRVE